MIIRKTSIDNLLLYLLGMTMSIGSGVTELLGVDLAKIFPVILCVLLLFTFFSKKIKVNNIPRSYLHYTGFILMHTVLFYCLFYSSELMNLKISGETTLLSLFRFFLFIVYSFVLIVQFDNFNKIRKLVYGYNIGFILSLIVGFYMFLSAPSIIEGAYRLAGGFSNSNAFGTSALQLIFMNFILYLKQNSKGKVRFSIIILIGLVSVLLSQSRGNILGLMIGLLFLFMSLKSLRGKRIYVVFIASLFSITTLLLLPTQVIESLTNRFNLQERVEDNHESRIQIWSDYLGQLPKYAIQGYGRDRVTKVTKDHYTSKSNYATHNRYLNSFVEFGIVGLCLFVLMLKRIYHDLKKVSYYGENYLVAKLSTAFLLAWSIIIFFSDYHNSRDFWLFIGFIISVTNILRSQIKKNGEKKYINC